MDLSKIKENLNKAKIAIKDKTNIALEKTWEKIINSKLTIKNLEDFELLIKKSKKTFYKNPETWEEKEYNKRSIVIIWEKKSEFYKDIAISLPIIATKTFSQNIYFRLASNEIKDLDYKKYNISDLPVMIIFENEKIYKTISWNENIQKLVKWYKLDINKEIDLI